MAEEAQHDEPENKPPIGALVALLLVAVLVFGEWFLTHQLGAAARIQDCVASGRTNCAPIASGR